MKLSSLQKLEYFPFHFSKEGEKEERSFIDSYNNDIKTGKINNNLFYYNYILGIIQGFTDNPEDLKKDNLLTEENKISVYTLEKYKKYKGQLPAKAIIEIEDSLKNISPQIGKYVYQTRKWYYDFYEKGINWYKENILVQK